MGFFLFRFFLFPFFFFKSLTKKSFPNRTLFFSFLFDPQYTNVPHTSLGNLEKMLFKKKKNQKEPTKEESATHSTSTGARPATGSGDSQQPGNTTSAPGSRDSASGGANNANGEQSPSSSSGGSSSPSSKPGSTGAIPAAARRTSSVSSEPRGMSSDSLGEKGGSLVPKTDEVDSPSHDIDIFTSTSTSTSNPEQNPSSPTSGFGALHNSFDLDFGMTLNPALTATPLDDSPFAETPSTISIPIIAPIVNTPASEDNPFE
jgi:hypothetical protein